MSLDIDIATWTVELFETHGTEGIEAWCKLKLNKELRFSHEEHLFQANS